MPALLILLTLLCFGCHPSNPMPTVCPVGYEGSRCDLLMREKFIGAYTGTDKIDGQTFFYNCQIDPSNKDSLLFYIRVAGEFSFTAVVTASNEFEIMRLSSSEVTLKNLPKGKRKAETGELNFTYHLSDLTGAVRRVQTSLMPLDFD